ncbi:MAG: ABC transporter ATP-binding protein [Alphaproteobacteria bacterium]|nr:MAG: ABC transporter ATP-binding protein [Alphaproteobacteria bacterium]
MPSVELHDVSVSFPVYSAGNRSLKNAMLAATTGGRIGTDANHVVVQALDQVSLAFAHGDRIALIGHNGAGKTTLLRVLAGIFEPLIGTVHVEGKVTPMFDISLGIDPECTGYENIIIRGLYLGLTKAETLERIDEVARFTELGQFLELPVRTYSAGMQARLAFAMATCIEPEILLLDEGISAGDAAFWEKANERLDAFVAKAGILVLASHSLELVRRLCTKAVLMEHGRVKWTGSVEEALQIYRGPVA